MTPVDINALMDQELARDREMWIRKLGEVVFLFARLEEASFSAIRLMSGGRIAKTDARLRLKDRNARALALLRARLCFPHHREVVDRWASLLASIDRVAHKRNDVVHNPFIVQATFTTAQLEKGAVKIESGLGMMQDDARPLLTLPDVSRFVEELVPLREEAIRLHGPTVAAAEEVGLNVDEDDLLTLPDLLSGRRVDVLWTRGMADEWHRGTLLEGGRVQLDKPFDFVPDGPFVLEREEIADLRLAES